MLRKGDWPGGSEPFPNEGERDMTQRSQRREGIREWLLAGGGGFDGTLEASTFTFEGLIDYIDAFAALAVDGALARCALEASQGEGRTYKNPADETPWW